MKGVSHLDEATEPKNLDIFQHIKLNLKNASSNCACENTEQFYCIPCKLSTCSACTLTGHQRHMLVKKREYMLTPSKVDALFEDFDMFIRQTPLLNDSTAVKAATIKHVDEFIALIHQKLEQYRERKYKEIEMMFKEMQPNTEKLKAQAHKAKSNLQSYVDKHKKFYGDDDDGNGNGNDDSANTLMVKNDNTRFLMNYDMVNLLYQKKKQLGFIAKELQDHLHSYESIQKDEHANITNQLDMMLFPQNKNTNNNVNNVSSSSSGNSNSKLRKSTSMESPKKKKNVNASSVNVNSPRSPQSPQSIHSSTTHMHTHTYTYTHLPTPVYCFISTSNELSNEHFNELNTRISKYTKQIDSFKQGIYNSFAKQGNLKEIEKIIAAYENVKQRGADVLFSDKSLNNNNNNNNNTTSTPINTVSMLNTSLQKKTLFNDEQKLSFTNKDDISLTSNPLLKKYFAYLTLDLYNKNFRAQTKELQSSHADLLIKPNNSTSMNDDDDETESDFGKAIEGTNEVMLYEKRTNKLIKRKLSLNKNPFGYTKFPIGCRSLLIGDKLYITGGRDENQTYANVLIYDRKRDTLKRISDMREGRCYHTLIFNEVFNTIMVFGGDGSCTVEAFDPLTNRWQFLPELNIPRANSLFYFDKPRGIMYNMFGVEGSFTVGKYSDIVEFIDLAHPDNGWMILDYKNKSEIDLRSYMNVYPINNDVLLLYGGVTFRNNTKSLCVFNLVRNEVTKISKKMLESLRIEAKKNRQLSSIMGINVVNTGNTNCNRGNNK